MPSSTMWRRKYIQETFSKEIRCPVKPGMTLGIKPGMTKL